MIVVDQQYQYCPYTGYNYRRSWELEEDFFVDFQQKVFRAAVALVLVSLGFWRISFST